MSKRDTILLLEDMRESALKIRRYTDGLDYESFIADEKTIDATARNISVIGEAANRLILSSDYKILKKSGEEYEDSGIELFTTTSV